MSQFDPLTQTSFSTLGIADNLLKILSEKGYKTPTPIQHQAIPVAITGKDVVGIAQTGTGKTLAFGIPMIQRLATQKGQGLVILPTRELALQVDETLQKIGGPLGLRTAVLIGGEPIGKQRKVMERRPHILVVTPGRLVDFLEQRLLKLDQITVLVLDEADRMFDMGFAPQLNKILALVPKNRQTMLFSATMPPQIMTIATKHMSIPLRIEVAPAGSTNKNVEQEIFIVPKDEKISLLKKVLSENTGTTLVFSRTKFGAKRITKVVMSLGHTAAEIHSNRSLNQRKAALDGFKGGRYRILVATDIAARGIDVSNIELVINYDLPDQLEDYVHRIGRTGRAGKTGRAISFATPDQKGDINQIERLIKKTIPVIHIQKDSLPKGDKAAFAGQNKEMADREAQNARRQGQRQGRSSRGRGGSGAGGQSRGFHKNR